MDTTSSFDVCILVHNSISGDARVIKEATSLTKAGWRVLVIGIVLDGGDLPSSEEFSGFTIWRVTPDLFQKSMTGTWGKLIRLVKAIPKVASRLKAAKARAYHAHDFPALVLMNIASVKRPIIYDARELFFDRWPANSRYPLVPIMPLLRPIESRLARKAEAVITVSTSIAERLRSLWNITTPTVIYNAPELQPDNIAEINLRSIGEYVVVHTGNLSNGRHLQQLVSAFAYLPENVHLALLGKGQLRDALLSQAAQLNISHRIHWIPPVNFNAVSATIASADCAALMFAPDTLNFEYAMPNKLFEAIAAGLPLVYGTTMEVGRVAAQYELGISCDPKDPKSIAQAILAILEPVANARYRENASKAKQILNWGNEEKKLIELYRSILGL